MKTTVFLRTLVFGSVVLLSVGYLSVGHADYTSCDVLVQRLIKQSGGCPRGECAFELKNGKIDGLGRTNVIKTEVDTEVRSLGKNEYGGEVTNFKVRPIGSLSRMEVSFTATAANGQKTKKTMGFTAGLDDCYHDSTRSQRPGEITEYVDFDHDFCRAAESTFEDVGTVYNLNDQQMKACELVMKVLVAKYEKRSQEIAKEFGRFRASTRKGPIERTYDAAKAAVVTDQSAKNTLFEALWQRDLCKAESTKVNLARHFNLDNLEKFLESNFKSRPLLKTEFPIDSDLSDVSKKPKTKKTVN